MTTNQQLKAHCEGVIANAQDHPDWVVDMARVALNNLEAEPVVEVTKWMPLGIDGGVSKFLQPVGNLPDFGTFLYTAPPVPELKLPAEYKVTEDMDLGAKHGFESGYRKAIRDIKLLNGVKS